MLYTLSDCVTGLEPVCRTLLEISLADQRLVFTFTAEDSQCCCPHSGYNQNHYEGDVCEVFFGAGRDRSTYYEVEVSPNNDLFFGKIRYLGMDSRGIHQTQLTLLDRCDCFVSSRVERIEGGYTARISVDLTRLGGREDIFFNAFRIETDGGEPEKHLLALQPTGQPRFHVPSAFLTLKDCL